VRDGDEPGDPGAAADDEFVIPPPSDPWRSRAAKTGSAVETTLTGVLGFDDIEGGCSYLETANGSRYEVIYPDAWTLDLVRAELRGPGGQLACAGEPVTVRGALATDRSSTSQIGPIFAATDVTILPG
jgi:hypothetical protein